MWLIVLDRSGSMGNPFTGLGPADVKGRTRLADDPSKWAAATRVVLDEVASLANGERVCVIAFNDAAATVFDGTPAQAQTLETTLANITPSGGTELADALDAAAALAASSGDAQISVVVISDGLAEETAAGKAAAALALRVGMIEVMLIDPTPEAQAVAKAVAVRGRVTSIVSADEMPSIGRETLQRHVEETARVQRALARADEESLAVAGLVPAKERLGFTVGYPARPLAETWTPLSVYLHLCREDLEREVRRRLDVLAQQAGLPVADSRTSAFLNRGTWLTITPRVEGVRFNPPSHVVAWFEDLQEVAFRFRVPQALASRSLAGSIEITGESGLWLADLAITLRALAPGEALPGGDALAGLDTCRLPEQIFASYSHADREVVEACAAVYKSLGVHLYIDRNDLTVAHEWHPGLMQLIDRSEVFQLYWSDTSKASPHVRQEWEHALAQRGRKGARFLRGVYWREPMPAPPEPLAALHFGYLDLRALTGPAAAPVAVAPTAAVPIEPSAATGGTEAQVVSAALVLQRAAALQATVLPLLPGLTRLDVAALREQARLAAAFLEAATGLRYQPVPTLVVDEHLVHEVRDVLQMVDTQPAFDAATATQAKAEMESCRDVLAAQMLEFHVRKVPPLVSASVDGEKQQIPEVSDGALHGLREFGEWAINSWTHAYLIEPWNQPDRRFGSKGWVQEEPQHRSIGEFTRDTLAALVDRASALANDPWHADRQIKTDFRPSGSSDPATFDSRTALDTVLRLHPLQGIGVRTEDVIWTSGAPWRPERDWCYEVSGTVASFAQVLVLCSNRLTELLPKLNDWSYAAPAPKDDTALQAIGYAVVTSRFGYALLSGSDWATQNQATRLADYVVDALYPSWRRARDYLVTWGINEMAGLGFKDFMAAYLARMLGIFKFGLDTSPDFFHQGTYRISQAGSDMTRSLLPDVTIQVARRFHEDGEDEYLLTAPFEDFVDLFERASQRFLQALDNLPGRDDAPKPTTVATRAVIETSSFGIFAPEDAVHVDNSLAQWMVSRQAMPQLSLPGVPRVLYCLHALEAAARRESDSADGAAPPPAALLSLALLVHEHFHALVDTAPCENGLPAVGPRRRNDWVQAMPLNEALAAWMEVHAMREVAPLLGATEAAEAALKAVWGYIRSGAYPAWPYRGAERVQAVYDREGIAGVHRLVTALRQHPAEAQRAFDQAT